MKYVCPCRHQGEITVHYVLPVTPSGRDNCEICVPVPPSGEITVHYVQPISPSWRDNCTLCVARVAVRERLCIMCCPRRRQGEIAVNYVLPVSLSGRDNCALCTARVFKVTVSVLLYNNLTQRFSTGVPRNLRVPKKVPKGSA